VVPTALREKDRATDEKSAPSEILPAALQTISPPTTGTVVLDVEQGGIVVPSFTGKSVRSAIELAQSSGLDLEVVGSGVALNQMPAAGAHVQSGARITVRFSR
jgi:cell division protein FtsI (penicillin-binding protein 3)